MQGAFPPPTHHSTRLKTAFFHRWRPQNETYLFGFRKHEQGKNARRSPSSTRWSSKAEEEIAESEEGSSVTCGCRTDNFA